MNRQEVLRFIREQAGDRKLTFDSSLETLDENEEVDLVSLIDSLETEFGIELPGEVLVELDTVGELCDMVLEAELNS